MEARAFQLKNAAPYAKPAALQLRALPLLPRMIIQPDPSEAWIETEDGRRLPLRGNYRLGRAPDNHVIIDGPKASRHHAAIHAQDDEGFWIIDLGSRNGTFRNNLRVLRPTRLRDGDRLLLAGARFHFRQPRAHAGGQTTTVAGQATVIDYRELNTWLLIADIENYTGLSQEWAPDQLGIRVGRWIGESQRVIENFGGRISKFLGDGFLACWESTVDRTPEVAATLARLHGIREDGAVKFRVAVHHGAITFGGAVQFGEENMLGSELNYVFRLEKLASELGLTFCASAQAHSQLADHLQTEPIPGEFELKGFAGRHRVHRILWPA